MFGRGAVSLKADQMCKLTWLLPVTFQWGCLLRFQKISPEPHNSHRIWLIDNSPEKPHPSAETTTKESTLVTPNVKISSRLDLKHTVKNSERVYIAFEFWQEVSNFRRGSKLITTQQQPPPLPLVFGMYFFYQSWKDDKWSQPW